MMQAQQHYLEAGLMLSTSQAIRSLVFGVRCSEQIICLLHTKTTAIETSHIYIHIYIYIYNIQRSHI